MKNKVFEPYKDIAGNHRVFLIANGPSLADTDLDLLENETTIAMNRVSLLYDKHEKWRPSYYLFCSTNVRRHNPWGKDWVKSVQTSVSQKETTSFVSSEFKPEIDPSDLYPQIKWFHSMSETKPAPNGDLSPSCFSKNIVERIDKSGTTINLALQLAYHMNFSEIIILGADLGWSGDRGSKNDPNHFDKSYRANVPPEKVHKMNHQMRNVHSLALKNLKEKNPNVKVYNASLKTVLDIYPIIDYKKYVLENKVEYNNERLSKAKSFWDRPAQFE